MATDVHVNGAPLSLEQQIAAAQTEGLEANLLRMLRFVGPRGPLEFQALGVRDGRFEASKAAHSRTASDAVSLCGLADKWAADGVYVMPVQLRPGVETRRSPPGAWYDMRKGESTTDSDVAARLVLGIDCDVKRPSKISATAAEMALSVAVASRAWGYLSGILGARPLAYVHSGNGRQIQIALDALPADEDARRLCASILAGLDAQLSTDKVAIDLKLSDAKRLLPAPGTLKKKGATGIDERPHRRTAIVIAPVPSRVTLDELRQLHTRIRSDCDEAGRAKMDVASGIKAKPGPAKARTASSYSSTDSPFDKANALDPTTVAEWLDLFESGDLRCPGCGESQGVDVIDHGLKCLHNRCDGKGKNGFRTNVDLTMEVRGVVAREAVNLLAERFGFEPLRDRAANENGTEWTGPEPKAPPSFKIWSPAEIWKPLDPPDYLMDGLLVRGSLALIVAYGSSLKTWALEDAVLSIATGADWMQRFATKKARALLIDFESGDYELRRRAHRLALGRELAVPIEGFAFATMPSMSLANDEFFAALRPLALEYGFIGIDSLAAGSGGIDENDARFATSLQRLKAIAAETGCVIVVLHHTRKGSGEDTDQREMVRGSSAIFNACDVVLQMTRGKDDAFVLRQTKARGGKAIEPFVVRVDDVGTAASVVMASNLAEADQEGLECASKAIDKAKRAILVLLASAKGLTSKTQVYNRIGGTKGTKVKALAELIESRIVVEHDGAWRLASEVHP